MRGCLLLLIGIVIGAVLLILVQAFLVPRPIEVATPAAQPDMTILFHNQFLTRELRKRLATVQTPVPLTGLTVTTTNTDNLIITGDITTAGTLLPLPRLIHVQVLLHPFIAQDQVAVQVVKADVGTLQIPGQLFSLLQQPINDQLSRTLGQTPYHIVGVSTEADGLVVDVNVNNP